MTKHNHTRDPRDLIISEPRNCCQSEHSNNPLRAAQDGQERYMTSSSNSSIAPYVHQPPLPLTWDANDDGSERGNLPDFTQPKLTYSFLPTTAKSRTVAVRLISMAMTGYYRTMIRPRVHRPLSMMKYDPVIKKQVLFLEATKGGKNK
ncbi:hypothetical protein N7467_010871 [Penicillium canescens]|nr:hypothetical protein N7467_010871 [Penicillium canescens]